ncbi:class I SAM-dependent methyltransferase [Phenylobacterium sp.]|uniref:class I SAM-dependent methyltransferase n=1 Tax=Phenylobacterium sp. TaxID=1871053 RepID=UPI00271ACC0B|nr:class I SAM-dependent methyltransferase [Phenylobacterium sp.]MDO8379265.1 class I SAM-dependent methyltransferase [Phenylobacterium sp.]
MSGFLLEVDGVCPVCEQQATFTAKDEWLRDHFLCGNCGSQPRERALMKVLADLRPDWRSLAIHESSPGTAASRRLAAEAPGYVSSHYGPDVPLGAAHPQWGWRCEDLENQTFPDKSFDLVVTQDVFEHLFAPDRAIAEVGRTLKPGGFHICTVPIVNKAAPSVRRARRDRQGKVEHLMEPVYHANPIDVQGSLVTVDWGYDIADYLDEASGLSTTIWTLDDMSRGIRAEYIEVLVSRKEPQSQVTPDGLPAPWKGVRETIRRLLS